MTVVESRITIESLHELIGTNIRYQAGIYEIIEVLEDGPSLVLQDCLDHTSIQADQHGDAHRRVPCIKTVPIPSDEFHQLDMTAAGIEVFVSDHY